MMDQQAEWFPGIALTLHPVYCLIRDDICQITMTDYRVPRLFYKLRIVVVALPRDNLPVVESGRKCVQVPFPDQGCLITCTLQIFRERRLRSVEHIRFIRPESIGVAVLARQHACTRGAAERISHKRICEPHAICGNAVEIRSRDIARVVSAHHLRRVVIGHNIDNIRMPGTICRFIRACGRDSDQRDGNAGNYGKISAIHGLLIGFE